MKRLVVSVLTATLVSLPAGAAAGWLRRDHTDHRSALALLLVLCLLAAAGAAVPVVRATGYAHRAVLLNAHRTWLLGISGGLLFGALVARLAV
jgi:hypothetical protein